MSWRWAAHFESREASWRFGEGVADALSSAGDLLGQGGLWIPLVSEFVTLVSGELESTVDGRLARNV